MLNLLYTTAPFVVLGGATGLTSILGIQGLAQYTDPVTNNDYYWMLINCGYNAVGAWNHNLYIAVAWGQDGNVISWTSSLGFGFTTNVSNLTTGTSGQMYANFTGPSGIAVYGLIPFYGTISVTLTYGTGAGSTVQDFYPQGSAPGNPGLTGSGTDYTLTINTFTVQFGDTAYSPGSYSGSGAGLSGLGSGLDTWHLPAVDDLNGVIMDAWGVGSNTIPPYFTSWSIATKQVLANVALPSTPVAIAIAPQNKVYVVCANRNILLIDYLTGEILGADKVDSFYGTQTWNIGNVQIGWDWQFNLLLVAEMTNANLDTAIVIEVYQPSFLVTRLTKPIPLQVPRVGQVIQAVVQEVGDLNQGLTEGMVGLTEVNGTGEAALVGNVTSPNTYAQTFF